MLNLAGADAVREVARLSRPISNSRVLARGESYIDACRRAVYGDVLIRAAAVNHNRCALRVRTRSRTSRRRWTRRWTRRWRWRPEMARAQVLARFNRHRPV